jgi:hypothetical protein
MTKRSPKGLADKARETHYRKTAAKAAARKAGRNHPKTAPKVAAQKATHTHRKAASKVSGPIHKTTFQPMRYYGTEVPDSMRALAETSVAQMRELYERSRKAFDAVIESWEKSFGGAVSLNRKIIDMADRNVASTLDLATNLAGAKTVADAVRLQTAYWRRQLGNLNTQAEELRALSAKVAWKAY